MTWAAVGAHILLALSFTLLLPMFRAPDEVAHVDMVRQYRQELGHAPPNQLVPLGEDARRAGLAVAPNVSPRPPQLAEDATPRPDRPSFADLAAPGTPAVAENHMTQHPPLYYSATAAVATFVGGLTPAGLWSWDREVYLYRLISVLLTAPLPLLAAEAALAARLGRNASAVAAASVLLVPQATAIGAGVNNDALVMLGSALAVTGALWHLRTGRSASAAVAASAAGVAALSKATAAPLLAWVVVVIAVRWIRDRRAGADPARSRATGPVSGRAASGWTVSGWAASAVSVVAGAGWYVTNLVRYRDPQPTGLRPLTRTEVHFEPSVTTFVHEWLDRLSRTYWGMPARRTGVALPWLLPHLLTIGSVALVIAAWLDRRRRVATALLWLLCAAQVGLLLRSNWGSHVRSGKLPAVQGRYLFTLLVPVAVLVVIGARQLARRLPARLPRPSGAWIAHAVLGAGIALHVLLGLSMLEGFWGAPSASTWERLEAVRAWSPLPSAVTALVLAAAVSVLVGSLVGLARQTAAELRSTPTTSGDA